MATRLILTLARARALQQSTEWPGPWQCALDTPIPEEPTVALDKPRTITGLEMIRTECCRDQILLQLNLKADGSALRQLYRLHAREQKKSR